MNDSCNLIAKYIKRGLSMKSFIVTGASASGKTTLINEAILNGYRYLPTHMTRKNVRRKLQEGMLFSLVRKIF